MNCYRPLTTMLEVPYVPESFIALLAEIARDGHLFPEHAPLETQVERQGADYIRIRISERRDMLVLRFDTLEVWRVSDCTLKYAVSYRGSSRVASWGHAALAGARHVLNLLLKLNAGRIHQSKSFAGFLRFSDEPMNGESGAEARPVLRPIGKRLKEIASVLPV